MALTSLLLNRLNGLKNGTLLTENDRLLIQNFFQTYPLDNPSSEEDALFLNFLLINRELFHVFFLSLIDSKNFLDMVKTAYPAHAEELQKQYDICKNNISSFVSLNDKDPEKIPGWQREINNDEEKLHFDKFKLVSGNDAQSVPLSLKPGAQNLNAQGIITETGLSRTKNNQPLNPNDLVDVHVSGAWLRPPDQDVDSKIFEDSKSWQALSQKEKAEHHPTSLDPKHEHLTKRILTIRKERIAEQLASYKVYVNKSIYTNDYKNVHKDIKSTIDIRQTKTPLEKDWRNMALGICHAQKIDLLAEPVSVNDLALLQPRQGVINAGEPAILLLSTPALNCGYGYDPNKKDRAVGPGSFLTPSQKKFFIKEMYRLLFYTAQREGYQYIALAPAGLGVFKGEPLTYFKALISIAKEFPSLNIIYNPGPDAATFQALLDNQRKQLFDLQKQSAEKLSARLSELKGKLEKARLEMNQTTRSIKKLKYDIKETERSIEILNNNQYSSPLDNLMATNRDVIYLADRLTRKGSPCALHNASDADAVLNFQDIGQYWKTLSPHNKRLSSYVMEEHIASFCSVYSPHQVPSLKIENCRFKIKLKEPIVMADLNGNNQVISIRSFQDQGKNGYIIKGKNNTGYASYIFVDLNGEAKPVTKLLGSFTVHHDADFRDHMENKIVATQLYAFKQQIFDAAGIEHSFAETRKFHQSVPQDCIDKCYDYLHILKKEAESTFLGKLSLFGGKKKDDKLSVLNHPKFTAVCVLLAYLENFDLETSLKLIKSGYNKLIEKRFGSLIGDLEVALALQKQAMVASKSSQASLFTSPAQKTDFDRIPGIDEQGSNAMQVEKKGP